ncbi:hypothetical protein ACFVVL_29020 [Kitasatospora sp. NPDC058115]|uniref:hypothetical protein n=1 Tax=Kitasatospora sp. NPDC058115 TaxID=3346347 RepID=UPI0036D7CF63
MTPKDFHFPTDRETALAFGEPVAVLRDAPADWPVAMGRHSFNDFFYQIDVGYHLPDGEPVGTVSTVLQLAEPTNELLNFMVNSGRSAEGVTDQLPYLGRDISLDSLLVPVHAHHHQDCFSAHLPRLPHETGCIVVTGVSAYWSTLSALVLRAPADFPDTHLHSR